MVTSLQRLGWDMSPGGICVLIITLCYFWMRKTVFGLLEELRLGKNTTVFIDSCFFIAEYNLMNKEAPASISRCVLNLDSLIFVVVVFLQILEKSWKKNVIISQQ